MPEPVPSKANCMALARLLGLEISDDRMEELWPAIQAAIAARGKLRAIDLEGAAPADVFQPAVE